MTWRSPLPSRSVPNPSSPPSRLRMSRPVTETLPSGRGVRREVAGLGAHLRERVRARVRDRVRVDAAGAQPVGLVATDALLLGQLVRRHRLLDGVRRGGDLRLDLRGVVVARAVQRIGRTPAPVQQPQRRARQEPLGAARGGADARQRRCIGVPAPDVRRASGGRTVDVRAARTDCSTEAWRRSSRRRSKPWLRNARTGPWSSNGSRAAAGPSARAGRDARRQARLAARGRDEARLAVERPCWHGSPRPGVAPAGPPSFRTASGSTTDRSSLAPRHRAERAGGTGEAQEVAGGRRSRWTGFGGRARDESTPAAVRLGATHPPRRSTGPAARERGAGRLVPGQARGRVEFEPYPGASTDRGGGVQAGRTSTTDVGVSSPSGPWRRRGTSRRRPPASRRGTRCPHGRPRRSPACTRSPVHSTSSRGSATCDGSASASSNGPMPSVNVTSCITIGGCPVGTDPTVGTMGSLRHQTRRSRRGPRQRRRDRRATRVPTAVAHSLDDRARAARQLRRRAHRRTALGRSPAQPATTASNARGARTSDATHDRPPRRTRPRACRGGPDLHCVGERRRGATTGRTDTEKRAMLAMRLACCRCAPEGTRTPNLLIRSQMLYPLSYGRMAPQGRRRRYRPGGRPPKPARDRHTSGRIARMTTTTHGSAPAAAAGACGPTCCGTATGTTAAGSATSSCSSTWCSCSRSRSCRTASSRTPT